ncbi:MAG: GyrI-like domain-containing protein [Bacteroidales bacterium]
MKHEWRKKEKGIYVPGNAPEIVEIPAYRFFTVSGEGDPNSEQFGEYIGVLYSLSYGVKMSPKKGMAPDGFHDYTVYPLEGVWDLREEARKDSAAGFSKEDLVFTMMIRQPDFVDESFAMRILGEMARKKPHPLLDQVRFETLEEGKCVQMLHLGSYDSEPESFRRMEEFAAGKGLTRLSKTHREIYLSDPGKVASDKLKTVLRFRVE